MTDPRLDLALSLAAEGGRRAVASLGHVRSAWKRPGERVTSVDTEIQSRMLREIQTWFPGDGVVAEEAGGRLGVDREFVWALDPLDGTNNFALGLPCFAARGGGAFSGDRRLALPAQPLHGASNVCVHAPVSPALRPLVETWLARHKLRAFGSVALHLAYAAMGAIDLVVDDRATLWDIAAGGTIVLEAGGSVTALDGAPLFPVDLARVHDAPMPFVAGNGGAHREAVAALAREPAFDVLRSPRRLGLEPDRRAQ